MSQKCDALMNDAGSGVAAALRAVDCTASEMSAAVFGRLFAPGGAMGPVLTLLLGLFIAFFAIALMLGRSNLSIRSLVPKIVTLGLVVTFATSWVAYQSVVWNLAVGAPDYLAGILTGTQGSATATFGDKIDVVFLAVQQATENASGQADASKQAAEITAFSPQGILWLGALLLLLGTVGVLVTARIALALLIALGPIFVVMALFNSTRGLFTGWLKGVVMLGLTPLFAVLGGGLMLEIAVPILAKLNQTPGQIDPRAAMAFFLIGAVHVALMIMLLVVAGKIVSGWRVFGFASSDAPANDDRKVAAEQPPMRPVQAYQTTAQAAGLSSAPKRSIAMSGIAATPAANDSAASASTATRRETRVFATSSGSGQVVPLKPAASRTHGIGNRFRAADTRKSEKFK